MTINKDENERIQRETIRKVLDLFSPEGADFRQHSDFATIQLTLYIDSPDDPFTVFRGDENMSQFIDGTRGNGTYQLNDRAVDLILQKIK